MPDSTAQSSPDFSKVGYGAVGDVKVHHDASQHTTYNTTYNTTHNVASHTHNEDKSHHIDRSEQTTVNNSGLSQLIHFGVICVIIAGFVFVILALRPQPLPAIPLPSVVELDPDKKLSPVIKAVPEKEASPVVAQDDAPPPQPAPLPSPIPATLQVTLDRPDRIYYDKDRQVLRITVPRRGHLYAASVWADGQMRILCHPDLLTPAAGTVEAGQTVEIPAINMSFTPPAPSDTATEEEVRVVLSDTRLPGIPADRRADIRAAWEAALGTVVGSPHQRMRVRGGELPLPEPLTQPTSTGILQHTVPYRMIRGQRPVSTSRF
ncbi:MAG: hypothetical protein ACO1TE_02755 [Prosthecobacter sp.]